jgi:hypothetical protein
MKNAELFSALITRIFFGNGDDMQHMKKTWFIAAAISLMFLAACGGAGGSSSIKNKPGAVKIAISPQSESVTVGKPAQFNVTLQNTAFTLYAPSGAGCAESGNIVKCTPTAAGGI